MEAFCTQTSNVAGPLPHVDEQLRTPANGPELVMPVPVALVGEVALAVVGVVDMVAVLVGVVAALRPVLVIAVIIGLGVSQDVVDDTLVPIILGGDVFERFRLLPHLWRDLRTHRVLLPTTDATRVPKRRWSQTVRG
jgi:hypothetical protein